MEIKQAVKIMNECQEVINSQKCNGKQLNEVIKKKWVAVDDKFTMEISKMLILIASFTKEDTEGEAQLEEWQEYFKPITEKQSGGN